MKKSILIIVIAVISLLQVFLWGEETKKGETMKLQEIAKNYKCLSPTVVSQMPPFKQGLITWPNTPESKLMDMPDKQVEKAIDSTVNWARKILRVEWVPDRSAISVLALKDDVLGHDVVRFRYAINGYFLQFASTSSGMNILIQKSNNNSVGSIVSENQGKTYIGQMMDQFLQESDKIKGISLINVKADKIGIQGNPVIKRDTSNYWWGLVSWWTDGHTVIFSTGKADGDAYRPTLHKHWFSGLTTKSQSAIAKHSETMEEQKTSKGETFEQKRARLIKLTESKL